MRLWACVILLTSVTQAWAGPFASSARGTTTGAFLKIGAGARAVAMGEAYTAVADDATALYWNPAALSRIMNHSATFMHASHIDAGISEYGAFGKYLGGGNSIGAGFQYFSAGSMKETDDTGTEIGTFRPSDLALSLGYAHEAGEMPVDALRRGSVGVGIKYIRSRIVDSAQTAAVDIGVLSRAYHDKLRLAFTVVNVGGQLKYEREGSALPLVLRLGGAYDLERNWKVALDLSFPRDNAPVLGLGTEYVLEIEKGWNLAGRFGINTRTTGDVDGLTGLSYGIGFDYHRIGIDYGVLLFGALGGAHRVSASYRW